MREKSNLLKFVLISVTLFVMACMLPGMIPLKSTPEGPMPKMETNADAVIKVLSGKDWHYLQALAKEKYAPEDSAKPGTLTYTVNITDKLPVYFVYGWCTVDEATLKQNFEHITVKLYINAEELGKDVVQNLSYTSPDNLLCLDYGVLTSEWPEGEYKLKAVATFDDKINDGIADYEAGDYIFEYNVTVSKQKEGVFAPSLINRRTGI
jgi:hypothetical protein